MRKSKKVFLIISIVFIISSLFYTTSLARYEAPEDTPTTPDKYKDNSTYVTINPDDYNPSSNPVTADDVGLFLDKVGLILGFVRNISVIVAVISLMLIGIKYMLGSVEEKANYKATMWPYVVGCILAAGGTTIVTFIYNSVT